MPEKRLTLPTNVDPEKSTTIRHISHENGVLRLGFLDRKTGQPKWDYRYPDHDGFHLAGILAAERPTAGFRDRLKNHGLAHFDRRTPFEPEQAEA